ncbi:HprK-related kinase A [Methylomonas sp. LL1]|uniref:HprK-related kinase A n=1 Tax=Methylomonas sp. LL1 TaxID=2785785 RepID=UPI001E40A1A1|nr:HprK-related kinase A [Methylomonas sp. LL1]
MDSEIESVQKGISQLYSDYPRLTPNVFCDFYVRVFPPSGLRRFFRKQVLFAFDQFVPFKPLPYAQAFPFFEWGLNWCISGYSHQFLIIHAAVVEKHGNALILPGTPGSGKSTLCAALINKGWRLLSDELTLIDCQTGLITPVPRPVSLKNQSIELIANAFPHNQFSSVVHDTLKGSVTLMKPPAESISRADEIAAPCLVVFPKFQHQSSLNLTALPKAEAFMKLADLSFNYSVLGAEGFSLLADLVERCRVYDFVYDGNFDQASDCFEQLLGDFGRG